MQNPTPPSLLIRTDGGPSIGAGHVLRCLALAQRHLLGGGRVVLRTNLAADSTLAQRYLNAGAKVEVKVETLTVEPGCEADAEATLDCAERCAAECLVVDGYHFDQRFQGALCDAQQRVLWIDDAAEAISPAAPNRARWVLNQNLHATPEIYQGRDAASELLLGPRFALLRQEFCAWKGPARTTPAVGRRILVTLGGGDPKNTTGRVLAALQQLARPNVGPQVKIVVGSLNPHRAALEAQLDGDPGFELLFDVESMAPLMAWADLAITAAGSTCWELAHMGLPALVGILADNQVEVANHLERQQTVESLGWFDDCPTDRLADAIADWLHDPARRSAASSKGRRLVDGRGAERVLNAIFG